MLKYHDGDHSFEKTYGDVDDGKSCPHMVSSIHARFLQVEVRQCRMV